MKMMIDKAGRHRIYRYVLDWFYPNICPCCGEFIDYDADFCDECLNKLTPFTEDISIPYVDKFVASCIYDENISGTILHFKKDSCGNSYYAFAFRIMQALRQWRLTDLCDVIVPIPMTKKALKERGYNQSGLIAHELSYMLGVPDIDLLVKTRDTAMQKSLGAAARAENLKDAFAVDSMKYDVSGKSILLVDDVSTTGSTFREAAKTLKRNGVDKVYAAAFAKTPFRKNDNKNER